MARQFLPPPSDDSDSDPSSYNHTHHPSSSDDEDDVCIDETDVVEVPANEIPGYFLERGGRLFHSYGNCPYPLPVDADEQQRQKGLHELVRRLVGGPVVQLVHQLLAFAPGEQPRVLDLGTGTGQWTLDMAQRFPHARFYGVDIVPIATRYPPANVMFEIHDITQRSRYATASIDLVHARSVTLAVRHYDALVAEAARVLRPGGLFISAEWARSPTLADDGDLAARAPRTHAFVAAVNEALRARGLHTLAHAIPGVLQDSRRFADVGREHCTVPVGDWHPDPAQRELGRRYRELAAEYARGMREMLAQGRFAARVDELVQGYIEEMWTVDGMVATLTVAYARRMP
ncbi:S-adenosyl-L-methionine-dependent methyltransferase [Epithele typhae]|uniref:S-adenosyl-L-methionine-dependent methyltransferase n=1 Tax=Epithele typhae TaxID=378194 RepID=UPI002007B7AD|nr:S-adenosyl-L-methionine-dependent methyltransferase [Epithele typhae]KAH9915971.1 S-adenosyl-L-methionine-dependent methyltransferase [Epithele typhae]